jgi:DNA repair exonuclease SbcCD ATPase subunit
MENKNNDDAIETIIGLDVSNIMRIKAARLKPDATGAIVVGGANGHGKTSLLNAILYALGGGSEIGPEPLRRGSSRGEVTVELGSLTVTRRFTSGGDPKGVLEVRARDGSKVSRPQEVLDRMIGELTFDPTEFMRMNDKDKSTTLRNLAGINLDEFDARREKLAAMRRDMKARFSAERAILDRSPVVVVPPDDGTSVEAERAKLAGINEAARQRERLREEWIRASQRLNAETDRAAEMRKRVADLESQIASLRSGLADMEDRTIPKLKIETESAKASFDAVIVEDAAEVSAKITRAEDRQRAVEALARREKQSKTVEDMEGKLSEIERSVQECDDEKRCALASAAYPVEGLAVDFDGMVRFNGLPLESASGAERLKVSLAIGMATNPRLRVILIRSGSELDRSNLALVAKTAVERGYQVWIERVAERGDRDVTVLIEDGEAVEIEHAND